MREFVLERAGSSAEALSFMGHEAVDAHIRSSNQYLAGGTTLFDLMKLQVMNPTRLIDIGGLRAEHGRIEYLEDGIWLGASVRMSEAEEDASIRLDYPVIRDTLWQAASPQLRNMATLGGNVLQRTRCSYFRDTTYHACNKRTPGSGCEAREGCNRRLAVLGTSEACIANYPGDLAIALVALDAEVNLLSTDGRERVLPFEQLHRLPGDTPHIESNLAPGELITGFKVPAGAWTRRSRYVKVRDRASYDFALASAAVALDLEGETVRAVRIGLGGLPAKPWRSREAEALLIGRRLDEESAREAAEAALAGAIPHGEAAFKIELGRRTLVRALLETKAMELPA